MTDKGNWQTSAVCMLEISRADLSNSSSPDVLQAPAHSPAPLTLGTQSNASQPVGHQHSVKPANALPAGKRSDIGLCDGGRAVWHLLSGPHKVAGNRTGMVKQAVEVPKRETAKGSIAQDLFGRGGDLLDTLQSTTDYGKTVVDALRRGAHVLIPHMPSGDTRQALRMARVSLSRTARKIGKTSEVLETARQLVELASSFHISLPKMKRILDSDEPWSDKSEKLAVEFSAVCFRTIAKIGLEPVHSGVKALRTGAAMLGADVTHPSFGNRSGRDPRSLVSWQALNYFDSTLNYLAETVYDGDTIYAFLHTHVPHH